MNKKSSVKRNDILDFRFRIGNIFCIELRKLIQQNWAKYLLLRGTNFREFTKFNRPKTKNCTSNN